MFLSVGLIAVGISCLFAATATVVSFRRSAEQTMMLRQTESLVDQAPTSKNATTYDQARIDSDGFFTDVSEVNWRLLRDRHGHTSSQFPFASDAVASGQITDPAKFYQNSYEPTFTCMGERRIGGMGDGPKWVCDPHRIQGRCLVYSIGSAGKTEFERGIRDEIHSDCEVHTFDMVQQNRRNGNFADNLAAIGPSFHFHPWGIESEAKARKNPTKFKTLRETVELLNHTGREIDIFKIDCEGCEWHTYEDWFASGVRMRQILVEVHGVKVPETMNFFQRMRKEHYHIFHKEANVIARPCADAWEYALLRLSPSFEGSS